eukprot:403340009
MNSCMKLDQFSRFPLIEYWHDYFGAKLPKCFIDFRTTNGTIVINCPNMVQELYTSKNKYFDRHYREKIVGELVIGDSILFAKSTIRWAENRKHISSIFYKERLQVLLQSIQEMCLNQIKLWKNNYAGRTDASMDLNIEILDMLMDETQVCVFGLENLHKRFDFYDNGKLIQISVGDAIRRIFRTATRRLYGPIRELFEICDYFYITDWEKELKRNVTNFRAFLQMLVDERREAMKKPDFVNKGDLLTMLLTIDNFKNDDKMILDECVAFMIASTNATSLLMSNTLYYLTQFPGHVQKIRAEFKQVFKRDNFHDLTPQEWNELLTFDNINDLRYFSMCINETLRVDPPPISFGIQLTEPIEVCGIKLPDDIPLVINTTGLHYNTDEWHEPEKWIPERFDPESKYYLTPQGKRRNVVSFSPFLGGKRVCLGKTFAEQITRHQLAIIISQLDFAFTKPNLYERKPKNHTGSIQPEYSCFVSLVK